MSHQPAQESNLELESQFILRLPRAQADLLRSALNSGSSLANRLSIQLNNDMRHGCVKFDEQVLHAKLLDLPTIIESYKTLDRKNLYKTADISQILVCKEESDTNETPDPSTRNVKREFSFPHGITPPLKNVRKRRFRKTMKKKFVDTTETEKEVRRLFQFDGRAINVQYEVHEQSNLEAQSTSANIDNVASPMDAPRPQSAENSQSLEYDERQIFGEEFSSSSDESGDDDDDDDKDDDNDNDNDNELDADSENDIDIDNDNEIDNDIDNENENDNDNDGEDVDMDDEDSNLISINEMSQPPTDIAAELAAASNLISQNDDNDERRHDLEKELAKIRERIQVQQAEMDGLDNFALRQRLQSVLDSLNEQEEEIRNQIDSLNEQ